MQVMGENGKEGKKKEEDMINKGRKSCIPYPVCLLYGGRKCQLDTAPLLPRPTDLQENEQGCSKHLMRNISAQIAIVL
jgi:hypothetical protein